MRRVVVTGLGMVTPLANGVEPTWSKLLAGQSGIRTIEAFDVSDLPAKVGGMVPRGEGEGLFQPTDYVEAKELRRNDDFIVYGIAAAVQAVEDSGWKPDRRGAALPHGRAPRLRHRRPQHHRRHHADPGEGWPAPGQPVLHPRRADQSRQRPGLDQIRVQGSQPRRGHGLLDRGARDRRRRPADRARRCRRDGGGRLRGGARADRDGRLRAARALSTGFNETPERASRPWDRDRDGFVMAEGAGSVVLEEYEHAKRRGAKIYAEVKGYGMSGDAYHVTAPSPGGDGGFRSMQAALKRAGMSPGDIDYINAHGTSTPLGDEIELGAVKRLFGNAVAKVSMSSTKSAIGHLLGAAGAVEAIFCILAIRDQIVPPTLNLDNPSDGCGDVDLVPHKAKEREVRATLSNSFGFGGTNASVILTAVP